MGLLELCGGVAGEVDPGHVERVACEISTVSFHFKPENQSTERNPVTSFRRKSPKVRVSSLLRIGLFGSPWLGRSQGWKGKGQKDQ